MERTYIEKLLNKLNNEYGFNLKFGENFKMAFSHSSYTNEKKIAKHLNYERLEFLGDAVVELTTSEFLFKNVFTVSKSVSKYKAPVKDSKISASKAARERPPIFSSPRPK